MSAADDWKREQDAARQQWVAAQTQKCAEERDQGYSKCAEERDQGYSKCAEERDQGYSKCAEERDQGYSQCCDWWPCSWACKALVWISNIVCVAWTWISNVVCVAWTWISNVVCVAWTWVVDKAWAIGVGIGWAVLKVGEAFVGPAQPGGDCGCEARDQEEKERRHRDAELRACRGEKQWFDPERLVCEASALIATGAASVKGTLKKVGCWLGEVIEDIPLLNQLQRPSRNADSKRLGPILRSETRQVPSTPKDTASARSLILSIDPLNQHTPYNEEGVHIRYFLDHGQVKYSKGDNLNPNWMLMVPDLDEIPEWSRILINADLIEAIREHSMPIAVSYDRLRRGEWYPAPQFDMIAASGDRIIAKQSGSDAIYICITGFPFVHQLQNGHTQLLPQSYFKLDPEVDSANGQNADLLNHIRIIEDDERHLATERFPLFRWLFQNVMNLGIMDIRFLPRVWYKVDTRPSQDSYDLPSRYPGYDHVIYQSNTPSDGDKSKQSIRIERLLDLGVGLSHLHEQYDQRFGGECDSLSGRGGILGKALFEGVPNGLFGPGLQMLANYLMPGVNSPEEAYQLANGPIRDFGGWLDGTCIYYMLVQLKSDTEIENGDLQNAFAILWSDEQFAFTERWRVLQLLDRYFTSPFEPMVAVSTKFEDEFYPNAPFDPDRFWCPFAQGRITRASRMAVARQIVVVNGIEPQTGAHELYSIHFAWGTMDKTWRWRGMPSGTKAHFNENPDTSDDVIFPNTVRVREDTTIVLDGTRQIGGRPVQGQWFQRYLPADGQEQPSVLDLENQPSCSKPIIPYSHPWDFVSESVYTWMHRTFSHLGVLEPVYSRVQFYTVEFENDGGLSRQEIEADVWEERKHILQLKHERLNYAALVPAINTLLADVPRPIDPNTIGADSIVGSAVAHLNDVLGTMPAWRPTNTHPSPYNDPMCFKVVQRGTLGWILMYDDKRDDKLKGFTNPLPTLNVELTARSDPNRRIVISIQDYFRNEPDRHGRTVNEEIDVVSPPQVQKSIIAVTRSMDESVTDVTVSFTLARNPQTGIFYSRFNDGFDSWKAMNVWRVKLGAMDHATGQIIILFDVERDPIFTADVSGTTFTWRWIPTALEQRDGLLGHLLSEEGHIQFGTSLWFIGATGFACCADETQFVKALPSDPYYAS